MMLLAPLLASKVRILENTDLENREGAPKVSLYRDVNMSLSLYLSAELRSCK